MSLFGRQSGGAAFRTAKARARRSFGPALLLRKIIAWFARWFLWQGKVFDAAGGCLSNRITPL